jgi:PKD domain
VDKRRLRLLAIGVADLVVAGVSLGVSVAVHTSRAAAGTAGAGAVFVSTGTNGGTTKLQLDNLAAPGSSSSGFPASAVTGPIAVNSTATLAVAGAGGASGSGISDVAVIDVSSGASGPSVTLPQTGDTPVGIAMNPINPNVGYVVAQAAGFGGAIDRLSLNGTSVTPSTLVANMPAAPNGIGVVPTSIAVTPDGGTLLVGFQTRDYLGVDSFSVSTGGWTGEWLDATEGFGRVADIAVSPNGQSVYVLTSNQAFAASLPLPPPPAPNTPASSSPSEWATNLSSITNATSLTVSPSGSEVYLSGAAPVPGAIIGNSYVQALLASTGATIGVPVVVSAMAANSDGIGGVEGLSASPSGSSVLAYGYNANTGAIAIDPITPSGAGLTVGPAHVVGSVNVNAGGEVLGPQSIAVTPDQAPVASFTATTGYAGTTSTFNASASTVRYGSITSYVWSFGDGATTVTSTPVVTHVYASAGTDTVTLTETDSAGTSVPPAPGVAPAHYPIDGPGQTASRRADQSASTQTTITIVTPGTPTTTPTSPSSTATPTVPGTSTTTTTRPGKVSPVLILNPAVGPPGTIVTVTGTGFPKNTPITISWSISTGSIVVTTDAHGNLPASQLNILTPDILGPRFAVASSSPAVKAPFLVVPSTSEPGGDAGAFLFRTEGP